MLRHSYKSTAAATIAALTIALAAPTAATAEDTGALADTMLAACARSALGVDGPVTAADLASLEELSCHAIVTSLEGLEAATSLTTLNIWPADRITDLSPLTGLTSLTYLRLQELGDIELSPISTLTGLESLDLEFTSATSLPDLSALDSLAEVEISGSDIADLAPLADLDALSVLRAESMGISDLTPLTGISTLTNVDVSGNAVTDISPLATLPVLEDYDASQQSIDGGEVTRCELFPTLVVTGFDGATIRPSGSSAHFFGDQTLLFGRTAAKLTFSDSTDFYGSVTYTAPGVSTGCAWPSSFAPRVWVSGTALQDSTLTASTNFSGDYPGIDLSWYDNKSGDYLANGATFTPDITNVGQTPIVTLTITAMGMLPYKASSAPIGTVLGRFPSSAKVTIDGTAVVGTQPTATLSGAGIGKSYDERTIWSLDGKVVHTSAWNGKVNYTLPASAKGKNLSVKVQVRADGYKTRTYQGPTTTVLGALGELTQRYPLEGTFKVGKTVTAKHPTYTSPAPTSFSYQWMRCGKKIAGATNRTYTITKADAGCKVYVKITAKRSGYASTTYTSEGYKVPPLFTSAPTPKIVGTPVVGNLLKARVGTWSPTPTTLTYRWYRDGQAIAGATHKGYTLTKADAGHVITVKVTAKRSGYTTMTKKSAGVTAKRS